MLTLIKINNLALIEEVVWEMGSGLIGITGETEQENLWSLEH